MTGALPQLAAWAVEALVASALLMALVLLVRSARARPLGLTAGVLVWVPTVVVGMLLRVATGAGVQTSFVIVATVVLGVFLLGWRGVAGLVRRSRRGTGARVGV